MRNQQDSERAHASLAELVEKLGQFGGPGLGVSVLGVNALGHINRARHELACALVEQENHTVIAERYERVKEQHRCQA